MTCRHVFRVVKAIDDVKFFNNHTISGKTLVLKCARCDEERLGPMKPERYKYRNRSKY